MAGLLFYDSGWRTWTVHINANASVLANNSSLRGPLHTTGVGSLDSESIKNISDGTSHSIMVAEYHAADVNRDFHRTVWASTWRHHNLVDAFADSLLRINDSEFCKANITGGSIWRCRRQVASFHAGGGSNVLLCDGSVRWLNQFVDGRIYESVSTIANEEIPTEL